MPLTLYPEAAGRRTLRAVDTSSLAERGPQRRGEKREAKVMAAGRQSGNRNAATELTTVVVPPLDRFDRDLLRECDRSAKTMRLRKNRDVIVAGNHHGCIYINHDGWLSRYKILHDGSRQIVDFILPAQIFGLQACLFKRSLYSVATITEASLSAIPFAMIDEVFEKNPTLSKALFRSALCETAILGEHLTDAARRSAYERVSHFLLELFVRLNEVGLTDRMTFFMPLTQELIGDALGLTTVHVNRTFRLLRDDGLISIEDKAITILDFEALSLLSDFENSYLGESARAVHERLKASGESGQARGKRTITPAPA
jgi:CRP-like cAMP-binding protein